jgi:hypothetical protein
MYREAGCYLTLSDPALKGLSCVAAYSFHAGHGLRATADTMTGLKRFWKVPEMNLEDELFFIRSR